MKYIAITEEGNINLNINLIFVFRGECIQFVSSYKIMLVCGCSMVILVTFEYGSIWIYSQVCVHSLNQPKYPILPHMLRPEMGFLLGVGSDYIKILFLWGSKEAA